MKSIAILTSGGDAPGMNAAIRAVTRSALDQGMTVFGVRQGFQGLIEDQIRPLNARDVGGIIHLGGTFLGSARSKEFREESGRSKALRNLSSHGIEGLVVIGGNGSQTGSYMLSKLGFPVVGDRLHHRQRSVRHQHHDRQRHRRQRHAGSHRSPAHDGLLAQSRVPGRDHGAGLRLPRHDVRSRRRRGGDLHA